MSRLPLIFRRALRAVVTTLAIWMPSAASAQAQVLVPGTGRALTEVGDDFEDPEWAYIPNNPKSSSDIDKQVRAPIGRSSNGRWSEGTDRGHPDIVRRVTTPEGGLEGSSGALLLASLWTGVPGRTSQKNQQDDFFMNVDSRVGGYIPVSKGPSAVVRVYIPPFEEWERRNGASFGFRATLRGAKPGSNQTEPYWPGMFFQFQPGRNGDDRAYFIVRAGERGQDFRGPDIQETGWWTLGMSFSPDGRVHYFARPGVDDLTSADHVASHHCYGFRARVFKTIFFDVFSANNGRDWSTPWIIDDPTIYLADGSTLARTPRRGR